MNEDTQPPAVRGFWHGPPLGLYQLLCLRSFVDRGHRVEVFTYDDTLQLPNWVERRDANEIYRTGEPLHYQHGFGRGSPSLHSNLFRYAMLHACGGWWVDLDIIRLDAALPTSDYFLYGVNRVEIVVSSVLKFPRGHPLLQEAVRRCIEKGETCRWGETGSDLLTELVMSHGLAQHCLPLEVAYPIHWDEALMLFDPARCDEVQERVAQAPFLHLFNELWRGTRLSREFGPPAGSFLDQLLKRHDTGMKFHERMSLQQIDSVLTARARGEGDSLVVD